MTDLLTTQLVPGSEEWSRYITASKVSAIIGLSPYDSALSCWHKMKGNIPLEGETEDHRRGHYAEPAILAWWQDQHPEFQNLDRHTQYVKAELPWAAATPDAHAWSPTDSVLVEAKSARDMDEWGEPCTDEVPARYFVQSLWQMHLSGIHTCYIPVWGPWFEMAEYVVHYDAELAQDLEAKCLAFYESLEGNVAPELDDSVATFQTLKALHPFITKDGIADLSVDAATEFIEAADAFKAAEDRKRLANSVVLKQMGDAQYGSCGLVRVARRQPGKGESVSLYKVAKTVEQLPSQEGTS